ncbi:MAG TPA: peptidoglycan-binding protein [Methylophilaceae bacterium]|nr:peptidoglycan-binding protein [Methylophilaceae bacterium]
MDNKLKKVLVVTSVVLATGLVGCAEMKVGDSGAKTTATGSAGGSNAQNANAQLEKCDKPLGTMAVVEDQNAAWYGQLSGQYKLGSTVPVLKLLIQQSNCFMVVDRGAAMQVMEGERNLRDSGELRQTSNFKKGQMVAADYALSPSITFSNNDAGGVGGALGHFGGGWAALLAGGLKFKEASTLLTVVDNRSSVQVAAAEGSAKNTDFNLFGGAFGGALGGAGGGYSNTAEGKVIVAAFTDSYNNIVRAVKSYKPQIIEGGAGTGGHLNVQGEATPVTESAPQAATKKTTTKTKKKKTQ